KNYFYILGAIAGYFAFTAHRIPLARAGLFISLFLLSSLTALVGDLGYLGGPKMYFLFDFVAPDDGIARAAVNDLSGLLSVRLGALPLAAAGVYGWLMAKYGARGLLDMSRPWRLGLLILMACGAILSGYRSSLLLLVMVFMTLFTLEGL